MVRPEDEPESKAPLEEVRMSANYPISHTHNSMMPPPREIELKLEVPVNSIARLNHSFLLKGAEVVSKSVTAVSVYFDTEEMKLRSNGLSFAGGRVGVRRIVLPVGVGGLVCRRQ
jgi:hypothetical protein